DAVAQHADDRDFEVIETVAVEDGASDADHAGPDLVDGEGLGLCRKPCAQGEDNGRNQCAAAYVHGGLLNVDDTIRALTGYRSLKYRRHTSPMRHSFSFFVRPASARRPPPCYWWVSGTATEEAAASV